MGTESATTVGGPLRRSWTVTGEYRMVRLTTLTDRDLMRHWDVPARISAATGDPGYIDRMKAIHAGMDRREAEREKMLTQEERRELRRMRRQAARSVRMAKKTAKRPKRPKFPKKRSLRQSAAFTGRIGGVLGP